MANFNCFFTIAQALLVSERILGMSHKDTVFRYMYAGASYADASQVVSIKFTPLVMIVAKNTCWKFTLLDSNFFFN